MSAARRMQLAIDELRELVDGLQDNIKDLTEENGKQKQELQASLFFTQV